MFKIHIKNLELKIKHLFFHTKGIYNMYMLLGILSIVFSVILWVRKDWIVELLCLFWLIFGIVQLVGFRY